MLRIVGLIVLIGILTFLLVKPKSTGSDLFEGHEVVHIRYDQILEALKNKDVVSAEWKGVELTGKLRNGTNFSVTVPSSDSQGGILLVGELRNNGAQFSLGKPTLGGRIFALFSLFVFPFLVFASIYLLLIRPVQKLNPPPIASFSGIVDQTTAEFNIPVGSRANFAWVTYPNVVGGIRQEGNFESVLVNATNDAVVQQISALYGEGNGKTTFYQSGSYYIKVSADEPWSIKVSLLS